MNPHLIDPCPTLRVASPIFLSLQTTVDLMLPGATIVDILIFNGFLRLVFGDITPTNAPGQTAFKHLTAARRTHL
jgi:hypothetical protein